MTQILEDVKKDETCNTVFPNIVKLGDFKKNPYI
jgi:hypothetical protein